MGSSHARLWRCWQKFGWALTLTSAVTSPALTLACATGVTGPDSQNPPEPASTSTSFGPLFLRGGSAGSGTGADFRRSGLRCDSWGRPSRPSVQVLSVLPATLLLWQGNRCQSAAPWTTHLLKSFCHTWGMGYVNPPFTHSTPQN